MKKTLSLILALILCLGLFTGFASAAGLPFTDVPSAQWYYSDVKNAYDMSLINGRSATLFVPDGYLTYAEAVKLAACMNERYQTGAVTLKNGEPWYQTYVDYCKEEGIIDKDYAWNANATRAGYMEIFANALPESALAEINEIADAVIPDVPMSHPQAEAIYKLYRAGILQGNDAEHNCSPATNIRRCEVAAILTRMMDASERIRFTMGEETETPEEKTEPLKIVTDPEDTTVKAGETAYMTVKAEGGKTPYEYQWLMSLDSARKQWSEVSGQTSATLIIKTSENSTLTPAYRCMVTDKNGDVVYSDLASITVEQEEAKEPEKQTDPLTIVTQPKSMTAYSDGNFLLSVEIAGGEAPYLYQWQMWMEGTAQRGRYADLTGYTSKDLYYAVPSGATSAKFRCVITDGTGAEVISDAATVTAAEQPFKVTYEAPQYVKADASEVDLIVKVSGGKAPYTFIWMGYDDKYGPTTYVENWDGVQIGSGRTSSSLTVNPKVCGCTHYICRVEDSAGNFEIVDFTFTIR